MSECSSHNGLTEFAQFYGLGALGGLPVHYNAPFSLGVELNQWRGNQPDYEEIRRTLMGSGYVTTDVRVWKQTGWWNPYIEIVGHSGREYGDETHLRDSVLSVLDALDYRYDYGSVRFDVQTYDPQTGESSSTGYNVRRQQENNSGGGSYWDNFDPVTGDYVGKDAADAIKKNLGWDGMLMGGLAKALGVEKKDAYLVAGAGALFVFVLVLKR